jgi:hypothetical protein
MPASSSGFRSRVMRCHTKPASGVLKWRVWVSVSIGADGQAEDLMVLLLASHKSPEQSPQEKYDRENTLALHLEFLASFIHLN